MARTAFLFSIRPYFICLLGSLFYVYDFVIRVVSGTISDELMKQYDIGAAKLGLLSSFFFLGYIIMQIPSGMMYDKYGARKLLTITTLVAGVATYFFIATDFYIIAVISRLLMGIGSAFAYIGALFLASRWLPLKYFSFTAGLVQFMGSIGAILGEATLANLVEEYSAYSVIVSTAIVGIILGILFWLFIRDYPPEKKEFYTLNTGSSLSKIKSVLASPQNWMTAMYGFTIWAPISTFASLWAISYLSQKYQVSSAQAAILTSYIWIGIAIGGPVLAWLSTHLQSRKIPLIIAAVIGIISSICILYIDNLSMSMIPIFLFLYGVAGSAQAVTFGLVEDNNSLRLIGTATGFNNMAVVFGGLIFQPLVGLLLAWQWSGTKIKNVDYFTLSSFNDALTILPLCFIASLIIVLFFIKETHCQHKEN